MEIPADALLLESSVITTDESAMTGNITKFRRNHGYEKKYFPKLSKVKIKDLIKN